MGTTNMKTSTQEAFALAALTAAPVAGEIIQLWRLADMPDLRWSPEQADKVTITIDAHLKTRQSITEVSIAVDESWDGVVWSEGQYNKVSSIGGLDVDDNMLKKVVAADGERWTISYNTIAPYNRFRCWASVGAPANSEFEVSAHVSKYSGASDGY
jgi:hypothetical protein